MFLCGSRVVVVGEGKCTVRKIHVRMGLWLSLPSGLRFHPRGRWADTHNDCGKRDGVERTNGKKKEFGRPGGGAGRTVQ